MVKLFKVYSCYECPNMEYISNFDKWVCVLTENEIDKSELIDDDCPLEEAEEELL